MKRELIKELIKWKNDIDRKPILLRGARQVGKTYLIRELGKLFDDYVEINFEKTPKLRECFEQDLDPERILQELSLYIGKKINPDNTLIFFDEIGYCENAIRSLRYFYEDLTGCYLISAGSLLDFVIEEIGIPVGRVISLYLYPLSFLEFLEAKDQGMLAEAIKNEYGPDKQVPDLLHHKLLRLLNEYMIIGGMPEALQKWITTDDLLKCRRIHQTIVEAYVQDFEKYAKKHQYKYVSLVFNAIPHMLGRKVVYSTISPNYKSRELQPAFELLNKANVVHPIYHSSGNGVPLGAEANIHKFKAIMLDITLTQHLLGYDPQEAFFKNGTQVVNMGPVSEAFVGQEILAYSDPYEKSSLYYWHREKRASNAEVDYLFSTQAKVIPIEVKSGASSRLVSMRRFLSEKKVPYGIRFSNRNFEKKGNIYSYPLYAVCRLGG
jgi:predicted AAA+ superfamily ATPase